MLSRFHDYSYNNTLVIMQQKPETTLVNSYDRWLSLGCQVQKGEKGIKVFFPYKRLVPSDQARD